MTSVIAGLKWDIREGTTDWNTINAAAGEDEYALRDVDVDGKLVFDIGAHVGSVGVWLASRGATVVFIEPVEENVEQVKKNLALNDLTGYVFRAAVGTNHVFLGPQGDAHEFIANIGGADGSRRVECPEVPFTVLVQSLGLPDIVKLDCEGGEWAVFTDPLIRRVPLIVGEYHPDRIGGADYTAEDIATLLPEHTVETKGAPTFGAFTARLS